MKITESEVKLPRVWHIREYLQQKPLIWPE